MVVERWIWRVCGKKKTRGRDNELQEELASATPVGATVYLTEVTDIADNVA